MKERPPAIGKEKIRKRKLLSSYGKREETRLSKKENEGKHRSKRWKKQKIDKKEIKLEKK